MSGDRFEHTLVENHPVAWTIGIVLWIIGASLFIAMAIDAWAANVQEIDDAVWQWVVDHEYDILVTLGRIADFIGSSWVLTPVILGMAAWLAWKRQWLHFAGFVVAMVLSQLLIGPVKNIYQRPRPPLPLVETTSWSFPSGHAVATAAVAIALVFVLVPAGPRRRNLTLLAALGTVLMALSRLYVRAHWLSDVLAGAAMGAAVSILVLSVFGLWQRSRDQVDQEPNHG